MRLESLIVSAAGFGLATASPVQIASARITDGEPLGDLACDPDVIAAVGGPEAVAMLPTTRPVEVIEIGAIRTGKTLRAAALALRAALTCDVSGLGPGEVPRVTVLSLRTDLARPLLDHLIGRMQASPTLRRLMVGEPTADTVTVRHPTGRPVEIVVTAGARAGSATSARWSAGVVFDESPRLQSLADGSVVNLEEARAGALGRLLPGAQIVYLGSPWGPQGWVYEQWRERFGKPSADLVILQAPGWVVNPQWWTPARCADMKRRNPRAFATDVAAQFASGINAAWDSDDVEACIGELAPGYEPSEPFCLIDASSLRGDSFTYAIASWMQPSRQPVARMLTAPGLGEYTPERDAYGNILYHPRPTQPVLRLHEIDGWDGKLVGQVTLAEIVRTIAERCHAWGARQVFGDSREEAALSGLFSQHRITRFQSFAWSQPSKAEAVDTIRRLMRERALSIVSHETMRRQLVAYSYKLTAGGGISYAGRGAHDDYAALCVTLGHMLNDAELVGGNTDNARRVDGSPTLARRGGRLIHEEGYP